MSILCFAHNNASALNLKWNFSRSSSRKQDFSFTIYNFIEHWIFAKVNIISGSFTNWNFLIKWRISCAWNSKSFFGGCSVVVDRKHSWAASYLYVLWRGTEFAPVFIVARSFGPYLSLLQTFSATNFLALIFSWILPRCDFLHCNIVNMTSNWKLAGSLESYLWTSCALLRLEWTSSLNRFAVKSVLLGYQHTVMQVCEVGGKISDSRLRLANQNLSLSNQQHHFGRD